jgi:2-keto-4-pentenoate hydratase/2-oxohepta-3-ene-1,7-dioic acid hydratase in catechol pathway
MKLLRVRFQDQIRWGTLEEKSCQLFESVGEDLDSPANPLAKLLSARNRVRESKVPLTEVKILAPLVGMEKIICIGTNYAEHAREMGGEPPTIPVVFSKFPSAIIGPEEAVVYPRICTKLDFEAELVVVIGKAGRNIEREDAFDHVFGYCCGNDISARDWQKEKPGGQWLLGKTFDTFAPLGPTIVPREEIADPHRLAIQFRLNGEVMQDSNTNQLIFPVDFLIAHLSQFFTLKPGDLIFTGTPPGVGAGRKPPRFLQPGDLMEVEIEGLGVLRNRVTAAE